MRRVSQNFWPKKCFGGASGSRPPASQAVRVQRLRPEIRSQLQSEATLEEASEEGQARQKRQK